MSCSFIFLDLFILTNEVIHNETIDSLKDHVCNNMSAFYWYLVHSKCGAFDEWINWSTQITNNGLCFCAWRFRGLGISNKKSYEMIYFKWTTKRHFSLSLSLCLSFFLFFSLPFLSLFYFFQCEHFTCENQY